MKFMPLIKACVLLCDPIQASLSNLASDCWHSRHISALCLPYTPSSSSFLPVSWLLFWNAVLLFMCKMASSCYSGFSTKASSWERPSLATQPEVAIALAPNLCSARSPVLFLHISYHYQTLCPLKNLFFQAFLSLC